MFSSLTVAQLAVEAALLSLHVGLTIFISKQIGNGVVMFKNAFYYIYLVQSFADLCDYLVVVYILRLPSYAAIPPSMLEPVAPFLMFITNYLGNVQCLSHTMISLNRYTALLHPLRHDYLWRGKLLKLVVSFLFLCPLVVTAPRLWILWNSAVIVHLDGGAFALASLASTSNLMTGAISTFFALLTCVGSAFLNTRAFIAFHRLDRWAQKEHNEDYRLLIFALLGFVAQLGIAAFWATSISFGTIPWVRRILVILMPFINDVLCLSAPLCLLITSATLRKKVRHVCVVPCTAGTVGDSEAIETPVLTLR